MGVRVSVRLSIILCARESECRRMLTFRGAIKSESISGCNSDLCVRVSVRPSVKE